MHVHIKVVLRLVTHNKTHKYKKGISDFAARLYRHKEIRSIKKLNNPSHQSIFLNKKKENTRLKYAQDIIKLYKTFI